MVVLEIFRRLLNTPVYSLLVGCAVWWVFENLPAIMNSLYKLWHGAGAGSASQHQHHGPGGKEPAAQAADGQQEPLPEVDAVRTSLED